jgi:hypothetical protein
MRKPSAVQVLALGAAVVTVALTGAAFWLSYEHLHDVAAGNGLGGIRAWAWPGTVDLFIVAGELLILRAALRDRFDWFAYLLAGVGSLGSIALNVAGVGVGAALMEYVVAAVPPVAALLAFAAVMRQVHERLAGEDERPAEPNLVDVIHDVPGPTVERVPEAYPVLETAVPAVPEAVPAGVRLLPIVARPEAPRQREAFAAEPSRTWSEVHAEYVPEAVPDWTPAEPEDEPAYPDPLIPQVRADFPTEVPGVRRLKETYSIGQPRAQRIRDELMGATS